VSDDEGPKRAKSTSFREYVTWRFSGTQGGVMRNFQTLYLTDAQTRAAGAWNIVATPALLDQALATLRQLPVFGLVEQFDESLRRFQNWLGPVFPGIQFFTTRQNVTSDPAIPLEVRLANLREKLGDDLYRRAEQENEFDLQLYAAAFALFGGRGLERDSQLSSEPIMADAAASACAEEAHEPIVFGLGVDATGPKATLMSAGPRRRLGLLDCRSPGETGHRPPIVAGASQRSQSCCRCAADQRRPQQHLAVYLNGMKAGEIVFAHTHFASVVLVDSARVLEELNRRLYIDLEIRSPVSPRQLALSDDARSLGIFFRSLQCFVL